jgi:DNA ligase-associated metallophosphoesterase
MQAPAGVLAREWGEETVWLSPGHTAYLPAHGCLLVADFHLGKAHSFRRLGVPVPAGTTQQMLARLDAELQRFPAQHVVFLGDFLHAAAAQGSPGVAAFVQWRQRHADLALTLVRGNHDERAGDPPPACGVVVVDEPWPMGHLRLCHHPERMAGAWVVAGHRHPGAVVSGAARDRIRLPCFEWWPDLLVLPAFGAFTGMHVVPAAPGLARWVTDGQAVHRLP